MFIIKKIKEILKENKELKEENKKMDNKILDAKQEIAWLKMTLSMNTYGRDYFEILSTASRKIEEIEDILYK